MIGNFKLFQLVYQTYIAYWYKIPEISFIFFLLYKTIFKAIPSSSIHHMNMNQPLPTYFLINQFSQKKPYRLKRILPQIIRQQQQQKATIIRIRRIMSITISTCNQICNSSTNHSKSKMLYTFTKQKRFSNKKYHLCDQFYDMKNNCHQRSAGIGYGHKYDFTQITSKSPPPNIYNFKSDFDNSSKKGIIFGVSREHMQTTGSFMKFKHQKRPGPGTYQFNNVFNDSISYSIRSKHENHQQHLNNKMPGPAHYPITFGLNNKGTYFLSKYRSKCGPSFNSLTERAQQRGAKVPGPGSYGVDSISISPQGRYTLSRMSNSHTSKFGTSQRTNISQKSTTPGPGNYKMPSQFGYYISKDALIKLQTKDKQQQNNQKQNVKP